MLLAGVAGELGLLEGELLVFDLTVLLAKGPHSGQEGKLLEVVGRDEIRVPTVHVAWLVLRGGLARLGLDEDHELVVGELQDEFVLAAQRGLGREAALLEGGRDIVQRIPTGDVRRRNLPESHITPDMLTSYEMWGHTGFT